MLAKAKIDLQEKNAKVKLSSDIEENGALRAYNAKPLSHGERSKIQSRI
jgi:hypothetical protein